MGSLMFSNHIRAGHVHFLTTVISEQSFIKLEGARGRFPILYVTRGIRAGHGGNTNNYSMNSHTLYDNNAWSLHLPTNHHSHHKAVEKCDISIRETHLPR